MDDTSVEWVPGSVTGANAAEMFFLRPKSAQVRHDEGCVREF